MMFEQKPMPPKIAERLAKLRAGRDIPEGLTRQEAAEMADEWEQIYHESQLEQAACRWPFSGFVK